MQTPEYAFDVEGHTVMTPAKGCKDTRTLELIFDLFKGIAFGECIAIIMTLLAQLYIMLPFTTLRLLTAFPYWAIRTFGGLAMICVWIVIGMIMSYGFDHPGVRAVV
jgi:hypothetical protein